MVIVTCFQPSDIDGGRMGHGTVALSEILAEVQARTTAEHVPDDSDPMLVDLARRLEEGNRAYEERFGRVFIVRAAGRSGRDILEHLRHRLHNTDELERAATIDQLTQIAQLRIREVLA